MKRNTFAARTFWNNEAAGGNPSTPPAPPAPTPPAPAVPQLPPEAQTGFNNLLQRYGSPDAVSTLLYSENRDLRQQNSDLKKKIPGEGAIVLNGDEATNYKGLLESLTELGVKPGDIKTEILAKRKYERDAQLAEVATAMDWNLDALKAVQGIDGMSFETREEADPANPDVKVKKVYTKNAQGQDVPIDQLPTVAPLLPALQKQATAPEPTGVRWVQQPAGGAPPAPTDKVGAFIQQEQTRSAAPNPLMPNAAPAAPAAPVNALGGR